VRDRLDSLLEWKCTGQEEKARVRKQGRHLSVDGHRMSVTWFYGAGMEKRDNLNFKIPTV